MTDDEFWFEAQVLLDYFSRGVPPAEAADCDIVLVLGNESTAGLFAATDFIRHQAREAGAAILSGGTGYRTRYLRRHVRSRFPSAAQWGDLDHLAEARIYERLLPGLGLGLPVEVEDTSRHTTDNFVKSEPHLLRLLAGCRSRDRVKVTVFQTCAQRFRAQAAGRAAWRHLAVEVAVVEFDRIRLDPVADPAGAVLAVYRLVGWKSRTPANDTAGEVEVFDCHHPEVEISEPIRGAFAEVQVEFDRRLRERPPGGA
jgi:hypothetical protein